MSFPGGRSYCQHCYMTTEQTGELQLNEDGSSILFKSCDQCKNLVSCVPIMEGRRL